MPPLEDDLSFQTSGCEGVPCTDGSGSRAALSRNAMLVGLESSTRVEVRRCR